MESQRAVLGDAAVDASIATLREKVAALELGGPPEQLTLLTVLFCDMVGFTPMAGLASVSLEEGELKTAGAHVD